MNRKVEEEVLEDALSAVLVVEQVGLGLDEDLLGQLGGAGSEVDHALREGHRQWAERRVRGKETGGKLGQKANTFSLRPPLSSLLLNTSSPHLIFSSSPLLSSSLSSLLLFFSSLLFFSFHPIMRSYQIVLRRMIKKKKRMK